MLQREPEARPSANDLYTQRLPELVLRDSVEEEGADEPPDIAKTKWVEHVTTFDFAILFGHSFFSVLGRSCTTWTASRSC